MERLKALQARLTRQQRGTLNLIYLNALAEVHNCRAQLGRGDRPLEGQERTALARQVGKAVFSGRGLYPSEGCLEAQASLRGAAAFPNCAALELADWLAELEETVLQESRPVLLLQDRASKEFEGLARQVAAFFADVTVQLA